MSVRLRFLLGTGAVAIGAALAVLAACGSDDDAAGRGAASADASTDVRVDGVSADGATSSCDGGGTICGAECVDTRTDPKHCGACGVVCATNAPSTAKCVESHCLVTLATPPGTISALAVDEAFVYFINGIAQSLSKIPIGGGTPVPMANPVAGSHL